MWQEFAAILNDLNKVYLQLIELGTKKKKALVTIDMKTLEGLVKEEDALTKKIKELEQRRQKVLIHMAVEDRSIKQDTKMEDLVRMAPTPQLQQILVQLHSSLSKIQRRQKS